MINMKRKPTKVNVLEPGCCSVGESPYPYGLHISLTTDELAKLGIKDMPDVGTVMTLHAKVSVTSSSESKYEGKPTAYDMGLQITDMELAAPGKTIYS